VLERGAAHAFGVHIHFEAFESAVSLGQAVLQDALESGFGVALATAAAIFLFTAAITAANAVLEEQASQGKSSGNDGATAERVPDHIRVHARQASKAFAQYSERAQYCRTHVQCCTVD
jgi:hypothetical protein